jgi:myo-inositol-1(or 4)-monophosphatase
MAGAAYRAAHGLIHDFGEVEQLQVSRKGPAGFVSEADYRAEHTLRAELGRARPAYGFLLEEGGEVAGTDTEHRWIVDPLDGTTNFLHGIPHFAISLAVQEGAEIRSAVVYDPVKDEMFWAEKGGGAYVNDHRLRVSARPRLIDALIATGIPHGERPGQKEFLGQLEAVMAKTSGVRRLGAAALDLAYVAAGRYDGFWESHLSPWDLAAGILLVREAGGMVSEIDGGAKMLESGSVLATNGTLHTEIGGILRQSLTRAGTATGPRGAATSSRDP